MNQANGDGALAKPIDGSYFHCPEIFQNEQQRLFSARWVCAGHVSELAEVGDYFTRTLAAEPLLFVRVHEGTEGDEDSESPIQGFFNVCRHRGTKLVEAPCGRGAKNFQCPYHAWTYGLNGSLIGAPRMKDVQGFDPDHLGLIPLATETWNGFVFFKLADDGPANPAQQFHDFRDISGYGCDALVSTTRRKYEVEANWKLICQNYNECYHCALVHPQLNDISHYLSGGDQESGDCFVGGPMTLNRGCNTMNMTGITQRPSLPNMPADLEREVFFYTLYPNFLLSLHRDYVLSHVLWPTGPGSTTIVCDWLFHRNEARQPDFDDSSEVEFWHLTNQQDWDICEQTQLGVASRGYRPVLYHTGESCLEEFDRWYLNTLGEQGR